MTLVMLFSQIWDIVYYPFCPSAQGNGRRIVHWYGTWFKPFWRKIQMRWRKGTNLDLDAS